MPILNASLVVTYGSLIPNGAVPRRDPFLFTLEYTEESSKLVHVPPNMTDYPIKLDSISEPKFLLLSCELADVGIKLSDGLVDGGRVTSALAAGAGWIMLVHPVGQQIKEILVTTPASPVSGARVRVISFE